MQDALGDGVIVDWAMRYGAPSMPSACKHEGSGCERIAIIALYPQYSASTSASVYDDVFRSLLKMRWQPAIRTAAPWHDDPAYIARWPIGDKPCQSLDWQPEVTVASFGLPQSYFEKGDPITVIAPKRGCCAKSWGWTVQPCH